MGISFGKDTSWDDEEILLDGPLDKGLSISSGDLREDIKSTQGFLNTILFLEALVDDIPFLLISPDIIIDIEIQGLNGRLLSKGTGA